MFVKHGDATKSYSFEKTSSKCARCNSNYIIVDSKKVCKCSEDERVLKANKILTQEDFSTNFDKLNFLSFEITET